MDNNSTAIIEKLDASQLIFWDFDGVIKDSVDIKTAAFEQIFRPYGQRIVSAVKQHHEANGGMSRFEKMPLYLKWAGKEVTEELVEGFCEVFSKSVFQLVIDSPWVPGVYLWLNANYQQKRLILLTAAPQNEIEEILTALDIYKWFQEIFGSPAKKDDIMRLVLKKQKVMPSHTLMIGDSESDLFAARANLVPFILRRTSLNLELQASYDGPQFDDLCYG